MKFLKHSAMLAVVFAVIACDGPVEQSAVQQPPIEIRVECPGFVGSAVEGDSEFDALIKKADNDKSCLVRQTNIPE